MEPFTAQLARYRIRAKLSQAKFARAVGYTPAQMSHLARGLSAPYWRRVESWPPVLGLSAQEAEDFLDAAAVAASPPRVAALVARLERKASRGEHPKG